MLSKRVKPLGDVLPYQHNMLRGIDSMSEVLYCNLFWICRRSVPRLSYWLISLGPTRRWLNGLVLMKCRVHQKNRSSYSDLILYCQLDGLVLMERRILRRIGFYRATPFTYKEPLHRLAIWLMALTVAASSEFCVNVAPFLSGPVLMECPCLL